MPLFTGITCVDQSNEYNVKLDLFEGPLDLLLYLVTKSEVAIVDIAVAAISKQYLEYLDLLRDLNINIASEYLSMAATLVRLKARELLPDQEAEVLEEDGDGIVSRQQLVEKLLEYKKYKEAAGSLKLYEAERFGSYSRGKQEEVEAVRDPLDESLGTINVFDLISAFQRVLERSKEIDEDEVRVVQRENVRLDDRIEYILSFLEDNTEVLFEDLFKDDNRKIVLVVTFMGILELVKMKAIRFRQEEQFGTLYVKKSKKSPKKE